MSKSDWKDVVELTGIAAIVASLIFVGLELRQSQQIAFAEQEGAQIADFMSVGELISVKSDLVVKMNNHVALTEAEKIEARHLVDSLRLMHFFTRQRAVFLDHPSVGVQERALAVLLFENPGLRRQWSTNLASDSRLFAAMGHADRRGIDDFNEAVERHLQSLDDWDQ